MKPILKVKNLSKHFGGVAAVNNCTFEIEENSITALIGPNGAGKTTVFDLITGLLKPDTGEIYFRGKPIGQMPTYQRALDGIARSFQAIRIFPELSALENVMLAMPGYRDKLRHVFSIKKQQMQSLRSQALAMLDNVNLKEKANHKAGDLSYGQQKLVEIVRAVATGADLFLLDEPAAGVNRTLLHAIINIIKQLQKEGKTILLVEHDMGFVMELSQQIIVMDYGKEIAQGIPEEIQNNPLVLEAYLGRVRN